MARDVLSTRALNRATLERQLLLDRSEMGVLEAVEHLVGLQAQVPLDPYTALWSRLRRFEPQALADLLERRQVVRTTVMRATLHLVSAEDCLRLRPLVQPVLDAELKRHRDYGPGLRDVDLDPVLAFAQGVLADRPRSGIELRAAIAAAFPGEDAAALAYACRCLLALVQVPPRGLWGRTAQVRTTTAESWLGRPLASRPSLDEMLMRYLAAFGPATVADMTTWCGLTGLRRAAERLRPRLRTFRDERGRELFDLPDAPRPDPETPAPTRFLPEYDNVLLSHDDRSRFVTRDQRARLSGVFRLGDGSLLHDGVLCGTWRLERDGTTGEATLAIAHLERLTKRATASIAAEGRRLLRFLAADAAGHEIRFAAIG